MPDNQLTYEMIGYLSCLKEKLHNHPFFQNNDVTSRLHYVITCGSSSSLLSRGNEGIRTSNIRPSGRSMRYVPLRTKSKHINLRIFKISSNQVPKYIQVFSTHSDRGVVKTRSHIFAEHEIIFKTKPPTTCAHLQMVVWRDCCTEMRACGTKELVPDQLRHDLSLNPTLQRDRRCASGVLSIAPTPYRGSPNESSIATENFYRKNKNKIC